MTMTKMVNTTRTIIVPGRIANTKRVHRARGRPSSGDGTILDVEYLVSMSDIHELYGYKTLIGMREMHGRMHL